MPHEPTDYVPGVDKVVVLDPWEDPQPFFVETKAAPYPLESLPGSLRTAVEEVQRFTQAPVPLVAASALGAISLAIQAHVDVERSPSLYGPVSLFLLTIAESGERKSTCDTYFTAPIREYEDQQRAALKPDLADHRAAVAAWEAKQSGVKAKIQQETRAAKSTAELEDDLRELEAKKPVAPRIPRLIYSDATQEKLITELATNWPTAGIISSEGGAVFGAHSMRPDSLMRTLSTLNVLWDGGTLHSDRKTTESVRVNSARLTVALQVQEPTLKQFIDSTSGLARGSGFLARFLFSRPDSTQGYRPFSDARPNLDAYYRRLSEILNQALPLDEDGTLAPSRLTLSPGAKDLWKKGYNVIEEQLRDGGELRDLRDVASKAAENIARLAALFHVFEKGGSEIGQEPSKQAAKVVAWHLEEAKRFLGEIALPVEEVNAAKLDEWLIDYCREHGSRWVKTSDALQFAPRPIRKRAILDPALEVLTELHRAREFKRGKEKLISINPALLKERGR
ncbi:MAG: YfjI family protein [Proteobacteria bacterium]|nr:YfjI family protein [Pseudomonadota bacterium]